MNDKRVVLTTAATVREANRLADALVQRRLAACVNVIPNVISVYRWNGNVDRDYEQMLLIKTVDERIEELRETLSSLHPYQVPEFLVLPIDRIEGPYLDWLVAAVTAP